MIVSWINDDELSTPATKRVARVRRMVRIIPAVGTNRIIHTGSGEREPLSTS
jgi:hypothetical protein